MFTPGESIIVTWYEGISRNSREINLNAVKRERKNVKVCVKPASKRKKLLKNDRH